MTQVRAKIAASRISPLVEAARSQLAITRALDGVWWIMRNDGGIGAYSQAQAVKEREKATAFLVLAAAGIEDAHEYDWHLWCHDAELMVREVVKADRERRHAAAEIAPVRALVHLARAACRRAC